MVFIFNKKRVEGISTNGLKFISTVGEIHDTVI